MKLHHLIADSIHRRSAVCHHKTMRQTLVATREDSRMITVVQQQTDDIRRHGRLACSSYREITHTDSGRLDGEREQQTLVIQRVPDGYTERVEPAERDIENAAHLD